MNLAQPRETRSNRRRKDSRVSAILAWSLRLGLCDRTDCMGGKHSLFFLCGGADHLHGAWFRERGQVRPRLFPTYFAWGAISGSIALPAFVAVPLCFPEYRGGAVAIQSMLILAGTLIMLYMGNSLNPEINAARDAGVLGHERFTKLHRRSVRLNGLVLVIGIGLLIGFANRPAPQTSGITELSSYYEQKNLRDQSRNPEASSLDRGLSERPRPESRKPRAGKRSLAANRANDVNSGIASFRHRPHGSPCKCMVLQVSGHVYDGDGSRDARAWGPV